MTRTLAQQEATARNLLRLAYAAGWTSEALAVNFAVTAMGEDARALVQRVFARDFKIAGAV